MVTRDGDPWFLIEVKSSETRPLNANLGWFQEHCGAEHAFQVVMDGNFVAVDAFGETRPIEVPARGFLSQLV